LFRFANLPRGTGPRSSIEDIKYFHQLSDNKERNIIHTVKRRKANWIGHILRRNCLLKHVIGGKTDVNIVMGGRVRRRKQLLDELKETKRFWYLKQHQIAFCAELALQEAMDQS